MCQNCHASALLQTPTLTRRQSLDLLAAGGLAALLAATPSLANANEARATNPAETDETVRIGYLPITDAAALLVAHAKGFYQDQGLTVAKPELIRGWSPLVEAFAARKFNLVHLLKPIPLWMRYNNAVPVKIVAWAHTNGSGLVVSKRSGIKEFADLRGRQIAVPYWYSMHNVVLQMALRSVGIEAVIQDQNAPLAENACNLQVLPPSDMPPALAAGKIDGYIVAEPFNALGELKAGGTILRFTGDIWKNHPCCVVCLHEEQTQKRPEWSQKVVNAIVHAQDYIRDHKAEVARLLSRDGQGYLPVPVEVVERAMTFYDPAAYQDPPAIRHQEWGNGRIDFAPWPYPSATRRLVTELKQTKVAGNTTFLSNLDPDFVASDLVDYRFVRQALGERGNDLARQEEIIL